MIKHDKVIQIIRQEYRLRPLAELVDYYKLFFQGGFGPGHMVHNEQSAREYLKHELLLMEADPVPDDTPFIEDIGWYGQYYRVNLNSVTSGKIGFEEYLYAFIESAWIAPTIDLDQWRKMWTEISRVLYIEIKALKTYDGQKIEIEEAFELESPLFHHSERYREIYHPHYRVIHADFINEIRKESK